jgi:hypothetical protein
MSLVGRIFKTLPVSGYRLRVSLKRDVFYDTWDGIYVTEGGAAMHDIVGDLPYPASYQNTDDIIKAIMIDLNYQMAKDEDYRDMNLKASDIINITFDPSSMRYYFECGPAASVISMTFRTPLALLYGMQGEDPPEGEEYPDTHQVTISSHHKRGQTQPTINDLVWSRQGHNTSLYTRTNKSRPSTVRSTYPVSPSLGTDNIFVYLDCAESHTIVDGHRTNLVGMVGVDWSTSATSIHQAAVPYKMPVKSNSIGSIRVQILDHLGNRIKFMPYDRRGVSVSLLFRKTT